MLPIWAVTLVELVYVYSAGMFVVFNRRWYGDNLKYVAIDSPRTALCILVCAESHILQVASVVYAVSAKKDHAVSTAIINI